MILDEKTWDYLTGAEFSSGGMFAAGTGDVVARNALITELSRNKRVLHVGCADHAPLIEAKRASGGYLHDLITRHAESVTGLDVNEHALDDMRELGITELHTPSTLPVDTARRPHLRPRDRRRRDRARERRGPVSPRGRGPRRAGTGDDSERTATAQPSTVDRGAREHRPPIWFSPYTLARSLVDADLLPTSFWYTDDARLTLGALLRPWDVVLKRRYPLCRDGLAVLAEPKAPNEP
jgi:hypothetical protein